MKYLFIFTPFELELDMMGIVDAYHFEFDSKSKELVVKGHSMRLYQDKTVIPHRTSQYIGVAKTSTKNVLRSIFHLYSTRRKFMDCSGTSINPNDLTLVLWLKVGWLNILIYCTVLIIETVFFLLSTKMIIPDFEITKNWAPFGFFGAVFTLAVNYKPDPIADVLLRPWKQRITVGAILFSISTVLTLILKTHSFNYDFYYYALLLYLFYLLVSFIIRPFIERTFKMWFW